MGKLLNKIYLYNLFALSVKCQHFLPFQDSYHNLTLKTVMGLKWMSIFCPHAKFILKTDDDIYVNVPLLTSTAVEKESKLYNSIHGSTYKQETAK